MCIRDSSLEYILNINPFCSLNLGLILVFYSLVAKLILFLRKVADFWGNVCICSWLWVLSNVIITSNLLIFATYGNTQSFFSCTFLRVYSKSETWDTNRIVFRSLCYRIRIIPGTWSVNFWASCCWRHEMFLHPLSNIMKCFHKLAYHTKIFRILCR